MQYRSKCRCKTADTNDEYSPLPSNTPCQGKWFSSNERMWISVDWSIYCFFVLVCYLHSDFFAYYLSKKLMGLDRSISPGPDTCFPCIAAFVNAVEDETNLYRVLARHWPNKKSCNFQRSFPLWVFTTFKIWVLTWQAPILWLVLILMKRLILLIYF